MEGRNVCLCAFGTPNSGVEKVRTAATISHERWNKLVAHVQVMFGCNEEVGAVQVSVATLFKMMDSSQKDFLCSVSMVQVSCDVVKDLLSPAEGCTHTMQCKTIS